MTADQHCDRRALIVGLGSTILAVPLIAGSAGARPSRAALPKATESWVNVRRFGARGDGKSIDSAAINKAIDFAAARGGGTVYVPPGTYPCYSIRLKSRITLHLEQGAVIVAAATPFEGLERGGYDAPEPMDPAILKFRSFPTDSNWIW